MKGGFIVICGPMMLSFILPVLIAPRDDRGYERRQHREKGRWHTFWDSRLAYAWVLMCNLVPDASVLCAGRKFPGASGTHGNDVISVGAVCWFGGRYPHSRAVILWKTSVKKNRSCGYLYSAWERRCWSGLRCTSHLPDRVIPISTAYRALLPAISAACLAGFKPGAVMVRMENKTIMRWC